MDTHLVLEVALPVIAFAIAWGLQKGKLDAVITGQAKLSSESTSLQIAVATIQATVTAMAANWQVAHENRDKTQEFIQNLSDRVVRLETLQADHVRPQV